MLIILEGHECCFKTTVAEKLSKQLNIPVVKGSSFEFSRCTNDVLYSQFENLTHLDNTIVDRFIYSNRVYATLYNDFTLLSDEQREEIERLVRHKATVFYLFADDNVIESRIKSRGDDYVVPEMVGKINTFYSTVMADSNLRVVAYDTSEWSSDDITEDIAKYFKGGNYETN